MPVKTETHPHLTRAFGLLPATALNMSNMVGIGPFITIPLLMASMGGPQSMLGWLTGALIVISDGLIWSELGRRCQAPAVVTIFFARHTAIKVGVA